MAHQFETVQFLPAPARERLSGELVCYARNVVHQEWPQMKSGTLGDEPNPWGVALFRSLRVDAARARRPSRRPTRSTSTSAPIARMRAPTARTAPRG